MFLTRLLKFLLHYSAFFVLVMVLLFHHPVHDDMSDQTLVRIFYGTTKLVKYMVSAICDPVKEHVKQPVPQTRTPNLQNVLFTFSQGDIAELAGRNRWPIERSGYDFLSHVMSLPLEEGITVRLSLFLVSCKFRVENCKSQASDDFLFGSTLQSPWKLSPVR